MMRVDRENPNKYFDESDASYEARKIWYAFKDAVLYKERFFCKASTFGNTFKVCI